METSGSDTPARQAFEPEKRAATGADEREAPGGEPTERDTTDEWRIEPSRLATVAELEGRIDVAVVTARAAEEAAMEIGAASLEAAEQARRAAALAERASATAEEAARAVREAPPPPSRPAPTDFLPRPNRAAPRRPDPFEERITAFRLRAEKVLVRLQRLEAGAAAGEAPSAVVRLRTGPPAA